MGPPETPPDDGRMLSSLRSALGPSVYRLLDKAIGARVRREVEARVAVEVQRALDERLPAIEARAAEAVRENALTEPQIWGPPERVQIDGSAIVNDALLNTESGSITVDANAFFGHRVCVLTGTHDVEHRGQARQLAIPGEGRDVHVEEGAWIGSGAIVLGPCRIGAHAVVAAGAVVTGDVPPATIVAGVPARVVRSL